MWNYFSGPMVSFCSLRQDREKMAVPTTPTRVICLALVDVDDRYGDGSRKCTVVCLCLISMENVPPTPHVPFSFFFRLGTAFDCLSWCHALGFSTIFSSAALPRYRGFVDETRCPDEVGLSTAPTFFRVPLLSLRHLNVVDFTGKHQNYSGRCGWSVCLCECYPHSYVRCGHSAPHENRPAHLPASALGSRFCGTVSE